MIELLSLGGSKPAQAATRRGIAGIQNVSLSVTDLDDTIGESRKPGMSLTSRPSKSVVYECSS